MYINQAKSKRARKTASAYYARRKEIKYGTFCRGERSYKGKGNGQRGVYPPGFVVIWGYKVNTAAECARACPKNGLKLIPF